MDSDESTCVGESIVYIIIVHHHKWKIIEILIMQTSMSVPLIMEGVGVPVSTQLEATTVHVPQDARWTPMVMLVMVSS